MKAFRLTVLFLTSMFLWDVTTAQTVDSKLAEALQKTLDSMHQVLHINGLGAALQLPDDAVWAGGSGVSTFFPVDSIGSDHTFATGSSLKTVTGACILQLVDEGVLSLDDSLGLWLPSFTYINPKITIRQLLRHQSGIYDVLQNPGFQPTMQQDVNQLWALEDVVSMFIGAPAFAPGANWGYSNTNYLLLGMIIETATGKPFHQELKDRFFDPMGLESFANLAYDPMPEKVAHLWLDITGDGVEDDAHDLFTSWKSVFSAVGPAGGYFAKPSDLARWMRASMSGSLVSPATWAEATETVFTPLPGGTRYGLGLSERDYLGYTGYGHGGDISYSTQAFYFPEKDISIAVNTNDASINSWQLTNTVSALLKTYLDCESLINETKKESSSMFLSSVYPNPFYEKLSVHFDLVKATKQLNFILRDLMGQVVRSATIRNLSVGTNRFLLDNLEELSPGIYFLQMQGEGIPTSYLKISKRINY